MNNRKINSKSTFSSSARRPNPKYDHVKAVVNTGMNMRKYFEKIEERERYFKVDKNEDIRRISLSTFVRLLLQVEEESRNESEEPPPMLTPAPTTQHQTAADEIRETLKREVYLLLDVRPIEDYEKERIVTAESYPKRMLTKVMNYESPSMLAYKNVSDRIIVVYGEDEIDSKTVVHTLTQRGYDNVYLLSGGLKYIHARFPEGHLILTRGSHHPQHLNLQDVQQLRFQLNSEDLRPHSSASALTNTGSFSLGTKKRAWK
ncbi:Centrosomal protein of 41 kDa [Chamberlinius hualienensis]